MQKDRLREELLKARDELQRQIDILSIPSLWGGGTTGRRSDKEAVIQLLCTRLNEVNRKLNSLNPNS